MDNKEKLADLYNTNQDKFKVRFDFDKPFPVFITPLFKTVLNEGETPIGFYEWAFNPLFQVFNVLVIFSDGDDSISFKGLQSMSKEELVDYLVEEANV